MTFKYINNTYMYQPTPQIPNQYDQALKLKRLRTTYRHQHGPLSYVQSAAPPINLENPAVVLVVVLGSRTVEMSGTQCSIILGRRASRLVKVGGAEDNFVICIPISSGLIVLFTMTIVF